VINAKEIETFSFGGKSYVHYTGNGGTNINDNVYGFWSESENLLVSYGSSENFLDEYNETDRTLSGHSKNENLTIKGSSNGSYLNLGMFGLSNNANDFSGTLTVKFGSGADAMTWYAGTDSTDHSIDLGAGDDNIYTVTDAKDLRFSKLDGGAGSDTLKFGGINTIALALNTAGAINFENIDGGGSNDNISGDNNANTLTGYSGADNISGYGGNDILGGHGASVSDGDDDNDILYGGAGNDILYGTAGANMMDGGTGQDNMTGGNGSDTFIIRSGDGGSALTDADIIMDFQDGTDVIGLSGGLNFDDLTINQGSGSNSSNSIISYGNQFLTILKDINKSNLSVGDFTTVN
jgi:Ca2+-binding RTX toxin-like protein